jgi:hypothetical protein
VLSFVTSEVRKALSRTFREQLPDAGLQTE